MRTLQGWKVFQVGLVLCWLFQSGPIWAAPTSEMIVAMESMPKTLDPRLAVDVYGMRITQHLLFETLIDQDERLNFVPALAERWEVPTPTTYLFTLRKNARFSNGEPLTARDVQASFAAITDPEAKSPMRYIQQKIKKLEALDDHTVRIELLAPYASFLMDLFFPIFQAPKEATPKVWIGSGPFVLVSQVPNEIVLKRNEHYAGPPPALERIVFKLIQEDNTRFLKFRKGEVDFAINAMPEEKLVQFERAPLKDRYRVLEAPGLSYQYLGFNLEHPVLKNRAVRQALAHGINRQELIEFYKKNHAQPAESLLSPHSVFYAKDLPSYAYDPAKAESLLEQAGFPRQADGTRLSLEYKTSTNPDALQQARIIQGQLKKIGLELKIRSFEWGTYFSDISSGNFEIFSLRWVGVSDPDFLYGTFHSQQTPPQGRNRGRYQNAEVDQLLEAGQREMNPEKRQAIYQQVQKLLAQDLPYLSLWYNHNVVLIKADLKGFRLNPAGGFQSFKEIHRQAP